MVCPQASYLTSQSVMLGGKFSGKLGLNAPIRIELGFCGFDMYTP